MLTRLAIPFALCLTAFAATPPVQAAALPVPTVSYSADRVIESEAGTMTGKVYAARGMERQETNFSGTQTVMILRHDKQLGYMLMPSQHMYQQLDFATAQKQSGSQPADQVDITQVGSETIEGQSTTKYKMVMKDGSAGGFMWITSDGIPMKMDVVSKSGRDKTRMTLTLKNLTIGAQDPQLFEVPAGYTAAPRFGGFGGMSGMRGATGSAAGVPSAAPNSADTAAAPQAPSASDVAASSAVSGLSGLGSAARSLFKRH